MNAIQQFIFNRVKAANPDFVAATKTCNLCHAVKPVAFDFGKDASSKDGRRASCRQCRLKYKTAYRASEKGQASIQEYRWSDAGKEAQGRYQQSEVGRVTRLCYQIEAGEFYRANGRLIPFSSRF